MKIEKVDIDKLKMYENNPRKNDEAVKYLVNSIRKFGFKVPVVIDKNNTIVAGHTRYKAAQELNLKVIPCLIADDLDDTQIRAFRIADNKTQERSLWDDELLKEELSILKGLDVSLEELGFLDFELDSIFDNEIENIDEFFADNTENQKKENKKVKCPECGNEFVP